VKEIALRLLVFSFLQMLIVTVSATADSYEKVLEQFIGQKRQIAQHDQQLVEDQLLKNAVLTSEQIKKLRTLLDESANITDKVYFGSSGLLQEAARILLKQKNFHAFDSVTHFDKDKAVEELANHNPHYKTLRDARLKHMQEYLAPVKRDIAKLINQKNTSLPYQTILKTFGLGGFIATLYKFLKKYKIIHSHFKSSQSNSERTDGGEHPNPRTHFPSIPPAPITTTLDTSIQGSTSILTFAPTKVKEPQISRKQADQLGIQLLNALEEHNIPEAKKLIKKGANIHLATNNGYTPLHLAARIKSIQIVNDLLQAGANIDAQTDNGYTPLYSVVKELYPSLHSDHDVLEALEVVKILLKAGASVNVTATDRRTLLSLTGNYSYTELALWFIAY
jgi:Ankyrin repeat